MLTIENFDIKLETNFIGRNFIEADEISSTNKELLSEGSNYPTGTVLFAEKQTEGKGRKNRTWHSAKEQNLTFSILLKDEKNNFNINLINLAAALTVANSIENLYQLRTELKWPNDVLVNKKKIAGILLETSIKANKVERVVIGIGVNVNQTSFQGTFNMPPASLKSELGKTVEREILLAEILNLFEEYLITLRQNPGTILKEWKAKCKMIGDKITITDEDKIITGIFDDIDDDGYLLLKRDGKIEKIHSGDVSIS